jgi:hypothetical protein
MLARLVESLQVNIEKTTRLLNWSPPFTVEESLQVLMNKKPPAVEAMIVDKMRVSSNLSA